MKKRGFTLIELLVVIAIIGVLASIVLVSVNSAREKARNVKRLSDIKQYFLALEMAYDRDNIYPGEVDWHCLGDYSDDACWYNGSNIDELDALNNILDDFIPTLPADTMIICGHNGVPTNCYEGYVYRCATAACNRFEMHWFLEGEGRSCGIGHASSAACTDCTYCLYP